MGCLGVHFALSPEDVIALRSASSSEDVLEFLEDLEESDDEDTMVCPTDKAWDAIHRCLTDGRFGWDNGSYPLSHAVMGGERVYQPDDYIMSLKTPTQVFDIAAALARIDKPFISANYARMADDYLFPSDVDRQYTWDNFEAMRSFYAAAANADRYVLFTASQ